MRPGRLIRENLRAASSPGNVDHRTAAERRADEVEEARKLVADPACSKAAADILKAMYPELGCMPSRENIALGSDISGSDC